MASERQGIMARALAWLKAGGRAPEADAPPAAPARADDPAPTAHPGIILRSLGADPWSLGSAAAPWNRVEDVEGHQRWLKRAWEKMPAYCKRAGLPRPDGE
jgi:hypothetical protein